MENYKYTQSWFLESEAIKVILTYLDENKINRILEIGCFEGLSSVFFADNLINAPESTLTCVDPFLLFEKNDHKDLLFNNEEKNFDYNIQSCKNSDKITIYKITSDEFFANNLNTFNFIYVDGCHEPEYIKRDLENSFAVLEDGGIMWMDDYDGGQTKETFDNFLIEYDGCYNIIHKGYQLAIQKKNPVFTPFFIENTQMETLPSLILDHYVSELNEKRYKDVNNEISILKTNEYISGFYQLLKTNSHTIFYIGNQAYPIYSDFNGFLHYFIPFSENIQSNNTRQIYNPFLLSNEPVFKNNKVIPFAHGIEYVNSINLPNIDLLHIDIQSFELNVLKSFENDIYKIKYILINYTGSVDGLHNIKHYLQAFGFSQFSCLTIYGAELLKTLFTPCVFLCKNTRF